METKILNLKKSIKVIKLRIAQMEKSNRQGSKSYINDTARLKTKTEELETLQNAIKEQKGVETQALKDLKNEAFTEFRGLFAAFNAIRKSIRDCKYARYHVLTNKVLATDVLEFIPFQKLVNIFASGNNYGSQSNFNALFDAVLMYMSSEVKDEQKCTNINVCMLSKVDSPIFQLSKVVTIPKHFKFTETLAHKVFDTDANSFEMLNLSNVFNLEEWETRKQLKAYETAKKKVVEFEAQLKEVSAPDEATAM